MSRSSYWSVLRAETLLQDRRYSMRMYLPQALDAALVTAGKGPFRAGSTTSSFSWNPARRGARVDPLHALRAE